MCDCGFKGNFYDRIKHRLHERIGREVRLAGTVVDLGCGSCDLVEYLARTYKQKVTGIDMFPYSFPAQRHTHTGVGYQCVEHDAANIDFVADDSVDAAVSMWALHEMHYPNAILAEAYRILRPGGEIVIVDFPRGSLAQKLWNENYYKPGQIADMLDKAGFQEVRLRLINRRQIAWARGWKPPARPEGEKTNV